MRTEAAARPALCSAPVGIGEVPKTERFAWDHIFGCDASGLTNPHTYAAPSFLTGGGLGCNMMQSSSTSTRASG